MRRLSFLATRRRLGAQLGLLTGLGLAFAGTQHRTAEADSHCPAEGQCSFKKPNFMVVLDYSSSMNADFGNGQTRWDAAVEAVQNLVTTNGGFFDESMHMALMRYGHDPEAGVPGSTIPNDTSGLVDGVSLDVHWYDPLANPSGYFECNGEAIVDFLDLVSPPLCQVPGCSGIGTWTNGALLEAQGIIGQTRVDHPDDVTPGDERFYALLLVTDGVWTSPNGLNPGGNPAHNPAPTAGDLWNVDGVPTYVVAFGDALGNPFADEIAFAGGTNQAIDAGSGQLVQALESVVTDIANQVIIPDCTAGLPRLMVILDASSSMLNVGGVFGGPGQTGWDQARDALAGANSMFDVPIAGANDQPVEDLVHLGLTVFGSVGEEDILVDYGPCMQDNFAWALDPNTSCTAPGCNDPWGGPPITWTFVGPGDAAYPGFDQPTTSHMPRCNPFLLVGGPCNGSGTFTHLGVDAADDNYHAYVAAPPAIYPINGDTVFANILITDGAYTGYSTDVQVQTELTHMYGADDVTTYVIGFGDNVAVGQLADMACWGSGGAGLPCAGGTEPHYEATTQADLEAALQSILDGIAFDPCCAFNDCSENPEPTTEEPDEPTSGGQTSGMGTDSASTSDSAGTDSMSGTSGVTDTMSGTSGVTDTMSGTSGVTDTMSGTSGVTDTMSTSGMSMTDTMSTSGMSMSDSMSDSGMSASMSASDTDGMSATDSMGDTDGMTASDTDGMTASDTDSATSRGSDDSSGGVVDSGLDTSGGVVDDSGDGGSGGSNSNSGSGGSNSNSGSGGSVTNTTTLTTAGGDAGASDTDDTVGLGEQLDDGCSCRTDGAPRSGWLGGVLLFGLGALRRRRRPASMR